MDLDKILDDLMTDLRPVFEARLRERLRAEIQAQLLQMVGGSPTPHTTSARTPSEQARPITPSVAKSDPTGGKASARVVEFMQLQPIDAAVKGSDILDWLQREHGVENRESARKAVTRAREMGWIVKGEDNLWRASEKLKSLR